MDAQSKMSKPGTAGGGSVFSGEVSPSKGGSPMSFQKMNTVDPSQMGDQMSEMQRVDLQRIPVKDLTEE